MFPSSPSGLYKAPATKFLLVATGITSFVASTFNIYLYLNLTRNGLFLLQLWRLLTHHFLFKNSGELIFGLVIIYYFRVFERQMGTRMFISTIITMLLISTSLEIAVLSADLMKLSFEGAYSYIFGFLVLFWFEIPASYRFSILGISSNDKLFLYLFAFQLFYANLPSTGLQALCGLLAGLITQSGKFGTAKLILYLSNAMNRFLPVPVKSFDTTVVIGGTTPLQQPLQPGQQQQQQPFQQPLQPVQQPAQQQQQPFQQPQLPSFHQQPFQFQPAFQQQSQQPQLAPSQENVDHLINMGFPRDQAVLALIRNQDHLNGALNSLLGQG